MTINWSNVTDPAHFLAVPNETTAGSFWSIVIFMCWIVLIIVFLGFNVEVALLASSFICLVASILLVYAGLVAWWNVLFFIGFILFMILYIVYSNSRSSYS